MPYSISRHVQSEGFRSAAAAVALVLGVATPFFAHACAAGAKCISVDAHGVPAADGAFVAQCRGKFADFIVPATTIPAGYQGPWFLPPKALPQTKPTVPASPWLSFNFRDPAQVDNYLAALRSQVFGASVLRSQMKAPWVKALKAAGVPTSSRWYPAPRMTYGDFANSGVREAAFGMTHERGVIAGELAGNTHAFTNYAVGYYNAVGSFEFKQVWNTTTPGTDSADLAKGQFPIGTVVFKVLYSAASPSDFPVDILAGAPEAKILVGSGTTTSVRLLQMDVAVRDPRATETGWVFATFVYDKDRTDENPWLRMVPLGLMWGNDPTVASSGSPITQSLFSSQAPSYAINHKGRDGRLNGPVDNRISSCLSCHSTAQAPTRASITVGTGCSATQQMQWFRNLPGSVAFGRGATSGGTCDISPITPEPVPLDYSLQLSLTVSRLSGNTNPCTYKASAPQHLHQLNAGQPIQDDGETFDVSRQ